MTEKTALRDDQAMELIRSALYGTRPGLVDILDEIAEIVALTGRQVAR